MKGLLVTGGQGFIGSKIAELTDAPAFDLKSGQDILDIDQLRSACREVEGLFHCAARISVPESFQETEVYHRCNVIGTQNVITVAEEVGAKVVFSSSAAVYGESGTAARESDECNPQSPYAENKRDGERLLKEAAIPSVTLRYFNVYGPGQSVAYAGVITAFIKAALRGEDLVINGDGNQVRDFVYVEDVVRANIAAMETELLQGDIFNIGSGIPTTINHLAETILRLTRSSSRIVHAESRQGDIVFSLADTEKALSILKWKPSVSLEDGLRRTIETI